MDVLLLRLRITIRNMILPYFWSVIFIFCASVNVCLSIFPVLCAKEQYNNADNGLPNLSDDYLTIYAFCSRFNGDYRF